MFAFRLFLCLCLIPTIAQSRNLKQYLDSLEQVLPTVSGKEKLDVMFRLAENYMPLSQSQSLVYATAANEEARQGDDPMRIARACDLMGRVHFRMGKYLLTETYFKEGVQWAELAGASKIIASLNNSIGVLYKRTGKYEQALHYYYEAHRIYKRSEDTLRIISTLSNIGSLRDKLEQYEKAIFALEEARSYAERTGGQKMLSVVLNNLGSAHEGDGSYEKALFFYQKALELKRKLKVSTSYLSVLANIFSVYAKMGLPEEARPFYDEAWQIAEDIPSIPWQQKLLRLYGDMLLQSKKHKEALSYFQKSMELAEKQENQPAMIELSSRLSSVYAEMGQYRLALEHQRLLEKMTEESYQREMMQQLSEMETLFDMKQKLDDSEEEVEKLRTRELMQRYFMLGLWFLVIMVSALALALFSRYRLKQRTNQMLAQQQEEIREQNSALERSNAELEQFAYVVSHDLQEPLRSQRAYAQLLQRRYGEKLGKEAREFLFFMADGVRRMEILLKDLLAYARIGQDKMASRPIDLNKVMEQVIRSLDQQIKESDAQIELPPLPVVQGYETDLYRLFQNIISNGLKFQSSGAKPHIRISAAQSDADFTRIAIKDNGVGIDSKYHQTVFSVFSRLHPNSEYEGTGLGLAISKKVMQNHQGRIWLESEIGQGTTFFMEFPNKPAY